MELPPAVVPPLHRGFLDSCRRFPGKPALEVAGQVLSYEELAKRAAAIAATLARDAGGADGPPLTAVLADRSPTAFAGVLGCLMHGHGYVPLNPSFPTARLRAMLERSGCQAVIVDGASAGCAQELLVTVRDPLLVIFPDIDGARSSATRMPQHHCVWRDELAPPTPPRPDDVGAEQIAYLLFTSGSTGTPKGVMVAHRNVRHFLDYMIDRYEVGENDRLSQTFDHTFDLSVFDMFVAWERGACVCCPSAAALMNPARFIEQSAITLWFCVPSLAILMKRLGGLKPGRLPTLRWSLFCGEPLPVEVVRAWSKAAPNSVVENLYGPTELTIACTYYRWDHVRSPSESERGVVPIGEPYPGMRPLIVDPELHAVAPGDVGELLMAGPQVTLGYWQDEQRTAAAFVVPPGKDEVHYRTGDLVRRPLDGAPMTYVGRVDHQIKVQGYRVELGEIEAALRDASGVDGAIALGWPRTPSGAGAIVAFLGADAVDLSAVRTALAHRLPAYMVPRRFVLMDELPLNANGKYDRRALAEWLEDERCPT